MTREDILKLAHEACILSPEETGEVWCAGEWQLVEFAELVAAAEREECAKVCDARNAYCAFAIRERGNK